MAETSARTEGKGVGVRCKKCLVGYGGNKVVCVYENWLVGRGLWALADYWVVHQSHVYKKGARSSAAEVRFSSVLEENFQT